MLGEAPVPDVADGPVVDGLDSEGDVVGSGVRPGEEVPPGHGAEG